MSVKGKILWFDDDFERRGRKAEAVAKLIGLPLLKVEKTPKDESWFSSLQRCIGDNDLSSDNVALFVVDHCLKSPKLGGTAYDRGAALCSILRMQFRDVPIVGVSNAKADVISAKEKNEYAYFLNYSKLPSIASDDKDGVIQSIKSIVDGYRLIRERSCKSDAVGDEIVALANPPDMAKADFQRVLPLSIRGNNLRDCANDVFSWYNDVLLNYQGVLVDVLSASAMIGATEEYFRDMILPRLSKSCQYQGIFSDFKGLHFWRKQLLLDLSKIVKDDGSIELSHYIERLTKNKKNWARCRSCHKPFTELAAYGERDTHDILNGRKPAHRRCVVTTQEPCPAFFEPKYIDKNGMK